MGVVGEGWQEQGGFDKSGGLAWDGQRETRGGQSSRLAREGLAGVGSSAGADVGRRRLGLTRRLGLARACGEEGMAGEVGQACGCGCPGPTRHVGRGWLDWKRSVKTGQGAASRGGLTGHGEGWEVGETRRGLGVPRHGKSARLDSDKTRNGTASRFGEARHGKTGLADAALSWDVVARRLGKVRAGAWWPVGAVRRVADGRATVLARQVGVGSLGMASEDVTRRQDAGGEA